MRNSIVLKMGPLRCDTCLGISFCVYLDRGRVRNLSSRFYCHKSPFFRIWHYEKNARSELFHDYIWNVIAVIVSGNQQVLGSPCQLAVCHWSPLGKTTEEDQQQTSKSAITFQIIHVLDLPTWSTSAESCLHVSQPTLLLVSWISPVIEQEVSISVFITWGLGNLVSDSDSES